VSESRVSQSILPPLVSILIPVFNRQEIIEATIESALAQTYANFEIVIVDNASTDETWQRCTMFADRDPRVRLFRNHSNIGPVRNWQRCADEARGEYGKLLFSDDLLDPRYLDATAPLLGREGVGLAFTAVEIGAQPGSGVVAYRWHFSASKVFGVRQFVNRLLFVGDSPVSPSAAIFHLRDLQANLKRVLAEPELAHFASHGAGADLLLFLLTARTYPKVAHVSSPLVFFRAHEGSISIQRGNEFVNNCHDAAKLWFAARQTDRLVHTRLAYRIARKRLQTEKGAKRHGLITELTGGNISASALVLLGIYDWLATWISKLDRRLRQIAG
jgi:glycosyltransferase involved in cell wall biosynthesis